MVVPPCVHILGYYTGVMTLNIENERTLLCHFRALSELLDEVNPVTREEFARLFPRTHNAVVKDEPFSFDLPEES